MTITLDSSGQLVVPKSLQEAAGIRPGMTLEIRSLGDRIEIQPVSPSVRLVQEGPLTVLDHFSPGQGLTEETVQAVRARLRERDSSD
ncbi:MAG: AbrB/MazE/SpoVT family DNA-binding domain-containing protein [Thermoanaerobaculia bacterium]|nr:AbrB/MazE/SpoVT family DNA-binding domain-containing protein [Thermoanaerobaculia bacterium]